MCGETIFADFCTSASLAMLPVATAWDASPAAQWIQVTHWALPVAGIVHLLAMTLLGGAILLVDAAILGIGLRTETPYKIDRAARRVLIAGLLLAILSGMVLASGDVMKLYQSPLCWLKLAAIVVALIFTFAIRNPLIRYDDTHGFRAGLATKLSAVFSMLFWLTVAAAGCWIAIAV